MPGQSTLDEPTQSGNSFYRRTLHVLSDAGVPFLVGGSHAFLNYTGIVRNTKDFDLFVQRTDLQRAIAALEDNGYRTEISFPHWLGKAWQGEDFVDIVFSSGNGICHVDELWFEHSTEAQVLGMPVKMVPAEELIWQKSFIMERDRYDGADIAHLLRARGRQLDWQRLLMRFDKYWPLLFSYCVLLTFIYPGDHDLVPRDVLHELTGRFQQWVESPAAEERVCQGTLISRAQYLLDIGQYGYQDARLAPRGNMSAEDAIYWTWAIANDV